MNVEGNVVALEVTVYADCEDFGGGESIRINKPLEGQVKFGIGVITCQRGPEGIV